MAIGIKILEKNDNHISFLLSGSTPAFANTLRRAITSQVPVLAIEEVEFTKNDSILYDEMIAHRMGLVPITTDLKSYNLQSGCNCKGAGCARCTLKFTLNAKGPGTIYAKSLKSQDPKAVPVHPDMPIAYLEKDQELELMALAKMNIGKVHAKWSPGHASYTYSANAVINDKSPKLAEFKDKYPSEIFDKNGKIDKATLLSKPSLIDACDGVCDDIIKIEWDQSSFIFDLESWGQLSPKEIVLSATGALSEKIDGFIGSIK